jgi:hypothetical protein
MTSRGKASSMHSLGSTMRCTRLLNSGDLSWSAAAQGVGRMCMLRREERGARSGLQQGLCGDIIGCSSAGTRLQIS